MEEDISQKILESLNAPIIKALDAHGITISYLARKLKSELNAREVKTFKAKVLKPSDPANPSSYVEVEEIIYSKSLIAWDTRQKARMDAHALRGDYPPEKREISGRNGGPIKVILHDMVASPGDPGPGGPPAQDPRDDQAPAEKDSIDG